LPVDHAEAIKEKRSVQNTASAVITSDTSIRSRSRISCAANPTIL